MLHRSHTIMQAMTSDALDFDMFVCLGQPYFCARSAFDVLCLTAAGSGGQEFDVLNMVYVDIRGWVCLQ